MKADEIAKLLLESSVEDLVAIRKYLLERGVDFQIGFPEEITLAPEPLNR